VFDHRIAYSRDWPEYALAARASRAATIGWIPNFADPTYFLHDVHSLLRTLHGSLAQLVVTSPIDVAFWKMRGIENVAYLPTPPSPCFRDSAHSAAPKAVPNGRPLEIVWWGRLEERTKRVTQLLEVAAVLDRLGLKFRLRIIGPDSSELTAGELAALVSRRGLDALVDVVGPRQSQDLLDAADSSDIFISTSIIEGYLLAVPEAQSRGLPVLMYDLPWLLPVHDDSGVITVAPPDPDALAHAIAALVEDEGRYATLSRASIATAERALSLDFASLYMHLFSGTLPAEFSPDPTLDDGQRALNLLIFSAEESGDWRAPSRRRGSSRRTRRNSQRSLGRRVERVLTPFGHQVLNVAPWLRPVARQMKQTLLRH
jgi:glycosyltransferase involved in cell wall biosynthesis